MRRFFAPVLPFLASAPQHDVLASVALIERTAAHPSDKTLCVVKVKGWNVVTNKERDNYQPGDLAVYMEIDTVIPEALLVGRAEHEILRRQHFRVLPTDIRGQISQGILFKMDILAGKGEFAAGDDVTEVLGVVRYRPPTRSLYDRAVGCAVSMRYICRPSFLLGQVRMLRSSYLVPNFSQQYVWDPVQYRRLYVLMFGVLSVASLVVWQEEFCRLQHCVTGVHDAVAPTGSPANCKAA